MLQTEKKVKLALDESRLMVLGAQILLGFQFRTFLEHGFSLLPRNSQLLRLLSLGFMLATILLLMWPITVHQIVEQGQIRQRMLRFASKVMGVALLPFALALGIDLYTIARQIGGDRIGIATGVGMTLTAWFFWYGWEYLARERGNDMEYLSDESDDPGELHDQVNALLTECRVVIPGSQALLGFQLAAVLMEGFERLPNSSKYVHFSSLLMITLSTILLMAPAAYHRIVERGEETRRLCQFAKKMLLSAMAALAVGLAAELFVVCRHVTGSLLAASTCASIAFAVFVGLWFGYTTYKRLSSSGESVH